MGRSAGLLRDGSASRTISTDFEETHAMPYQLRFHVAIGIAVCLAVAVPRVAAQDGDKTMVGPAVVTTDTAAAAGKPDYSYYQQAGFGMFIHWGPTSRIAGRWKGTERNRDLWGEWLMSRAKVSLADYEALALDWKPSAFDATRWATLAKDAGMGWMVFVAKHHDGYAMFRTKASPWNICDHGGWDRDPVQELSQAAKAVGIRFGTYYSHGADWYQQNFKEPRKYDSIKSFDQYFDEVCTVQVRELLTHYGEMGVLWFDLGIGKPYAERLRKMIRETSPKTLISGRIGAGQGDFTCLADCAIPLTPMAPPWETNMTSNHHWASVPQDIYYKSAQEIVVMLAEVRSKGGWLLLNVGPDAEGRIPPRETAALRQVGAWMKTYGEAIHGVEAGPLGWVPWGCSTRRGDTLHLIVTGWPPGGRIVVPGIKGSVVKAWMMGDPERKPLVVIPGDHGDQELVVDAGAVPVGGIDPLANVIGLELAPGATFDTTQRLDGDWDNKLRPALAKAQKTRNGSIRICMADDLDPAIEQVRHLECADLAPAGSSLTWTVRSPYPCDYHVIAGVVSEQPPGSLKVTVGTTVIEAPVRSDPWSTRIRGTLRQRLGTVSVPKADTLTITIQAVGGDVKKNLLVDGLWLVPTRVTPMGAP